MSFGPAIKVVENASNVQTIPIAGNVVVYSKAFDLRYGAYFAAQYKAGGGAGLDLTIQLEQSYDLPTTEGAADSKYVIPDSMADIHANLADTDWHIKSLSPVAMPYGRLKITGGAGNPADATLQMKLSIQESL